MVLQKARMGFLVKKQRTFIVKSISSSIQKNELNKVVDLTGDSLENSSEGLEQKTNLVLKNVRRDADKSRLQRRDDADQKSGSVPLDNSHDDILDRKAEDAEIVVERSAFDTALDNERIGKHDALNKFVAQERLQNDIKTQRSLNLLTAERAAHASTQIALTTREEFLAIVSHDLRNPLGTILSCAEVLSTDSVLSQIPDETKRWIEVINRNAATALRLISDILDVERIADGKLGLQFANYSLSDIIKEAIENQKHLASMKSILLKTTALTISEPINCDRDRVAQILSNLIGNALKFTPEGGSVIVNTQELGSDIVVSVEDTGPGIADDQKDHIFERLAQIGNKDRCGLGLGLFISKMLVESHGGKIWVESSPGQGSVFYFTLPKLGPESEI